MGFDPTSPHNLENVSAAVSRDRRLASLSPALNRHFRRNTRDGNDVEDLIQEVFLRMYARQGGEVANLEGYAFRTAATVLADRHRRRVVRHVDSQVPFDSDRHGGTDHDPSRITEGREALRLAVAEVEAFPSRTKEILLMRRLGGKSYKEIARHVGISISAVEKRLVKADERLRSSPALIE